MIDTKQYELGLWNQWKAGDESAKSALIKSMDPLLQKQVNKYVNSGLPRPALEVEAKKLTLEAMKTYDPSKAALGTHTVNHLKHLQRYVINFQNVGKIPENRALQITRFESTKKNMAEDLGREPNTVELADELSWSVREVDRMESELRKDLAMISGKDEDFFEDLMFQRDDTKEAEQFVYYDSSNQDRLIMEYYFGLAGKPSLSVADISLRVGKPESFVRRRLKDLGEKINYVRGLGM